MLPLKIYSCNAWMKSHTPIYTKQNLLRNYATTVMGVSLTKNHPLIVISHAAKDHPKPARV